MKTIIDTNVIIASEDDRLIEENIQKLHELSARYSVQLLVHRLCRIDIEKDKDEKRRAVSLSKLKKYEELSFSLEAGEAFLDEIKSNKKENDFVDDNLLFALYKDAVQFLVTEDVGIHKKAEKLGQDIAERVFTIEEFVEFIETQFLARTVRTPSITEKPLSELNLNDSIFDTLKIDYSDFGVWFKEKSREGRKSWVIMDGNKIYGICIPKHKDDEKEKLKLCTFKIDDEAQGQQLGELLMKHALKYAVDNKFKSIYLTVKERGISDKEYFTKIWLAGFGFYKTGEKKGRDECYYEKDLTSKSEEITDPLKIYPFFIEPPKVKAYIVPIEPRYHELLFSDDPKKPEEFFPSRETYSNGMKKVYISHAVIKGLKKGDLVFFYRSRDQKEIRTMGIVESAMRSTDLEEVIKFSAKRTVYNRRELEKFLKDGKEVLCFKFIVGKYFEDELTYDNLKKEGIIKGPPQSIQELDLTSYEKIKQLSNSFFAN